MNYDELYNTTTYDYLCNTALSMKLDDFVCQFTENYPYETIVKVVAETRNLTMDHAAVIVDSRINVYKLKTFKVVTTSLPLI